VASHILILKKGKYVLIPYTHIPLMQAIEYTLCCQYIPGQVEFNPDNENIESKNGSQQLSIEKKYEKDEKNLKKDQTIINSVQIEKDTSYNLTNDPPFISPKLGDIRTWEYTEETEELGNLYMYLYM
jgi:phosphosulfolactate phosphohydrolase-like enzyme